MATNVVRRCQRDDLMKQRVLIVEDEFLIALDLGATVEGIGMQVAGLANNREQALRLAPSADIAFVDVNLADGRTGPDLGRRLAEEHGLAVVFMTGNPETVAGGVKGAVGVVQKPVMPSLVEQLLKYLAARRVGRFAVVPAQMTVFA
ncbi:MULTISPECIES: response regulator [Rhizobium]|uniref:response regulator n=1 Tax=Rhizobium TaxID=379 RepID=UPI0007EA4523|nr:MULTISPECIES: response regulator [Rhizobium]ANK94430.1 response regulator CheY-like domain-containing protein [Rhizobium sp. N6212]ANL00480.1 response regulator CheY-like domain-containing protein [Rhizobium sp. N621]ANL06601.1 response regulator CheY-like domain-containing protein [Rhizobium esperanzae]ANL12772.1 response regulator CheY-like domain-containing protein [Rhizobium sp. N1341]ANL24758.1 response regulator CheY-like domain-containing protein [Rhizobium sp. N113]